MLGLASFFATIRHADVKAAVPPSVSDKRNEVDLATNFSGRSRLVLLGTAGGPILRTSRAQPANLLIVDGAPYLFDAGYGCLNQIAKLGLTPFDLAGIFVSHHHTDHNIDLASIVSFLWTGGRTKRLPIVGPHNTHNIVAAALNYFNQAAGAFMKQFPDKVPAETFIDARDVAASGLVYEDKNIRVFAQENTHYQTFEAGSDKSYSYRIECPDRVIVYTGDTGPSDALVDLAQNADVLVTEIIDVEAGTAFAMERNNAPESMAGIYADHMRRGHLTGEEAGKLAAAAGAKMLVLTHIVPGLDSETDMSGYVSRVKSYFDGPVIVGRDMLEV